MNDISIAIYDEQKIAAQGISMLLDASPDIKVICATHTKEKIASCLRENVVHIIIINIHSLKTEMLNFIKKTVTHFPKPGILIISAENKEDQTLKIIKAGARGFLSKDSDKTELVEAIYTLRGGHDFFSNTITHLLLNNYIKTLGNIEPSQPETVNTLSTRETEIVKLWGNSHTNKEIADKLFISIRTVESHKNHIMQKLNLKTSVDLVKFAIKNNIIEI